MMNRLQDLGEEALISKLVGGLAVREDLIVGPGDDCAVIDVGDNERYQLLKTDCIVEGVHYLPEAAPEDVGWKAVARVISDFAAMGGYPSQLLVTIILPGTQQVDYVEKMYQGMQRCTGAFGAIISGGETSSIPDETAAVISVSGTGWVAKEKLVKRGGGKAGDVVMVTGELGGSIRGKHLTFTPRVKEAAWLVENFPLNAMMDLSDGLAKDLPRLAKLSGCGYEVEEGSLPCSDGVDVSGAVGDGEDYELLFTVSAEDKDKILQEWQKVFPLLKLSAIGSLTSHEHPVSQLKNGWEHFTSS